MHQVSPVLISMTHTCAPLAVFLVGIHLAFEQRFTSIHVACQGGKERHVYRDAGLLWSIRMDDRLEPPPPQGPRHEFEPLLMAQMSGWRPSLSGR